MCRELAYTVERAVVKSCSAVGLCLQPDTHVLNGTRDDGIGDAGEGTRGIVLGI